MPGIRAISDPGAAVNRPGSGTTTLEVAMLVQCTCSACGLGFLEKPSRVRKGRGRYCSKACRNAWQVGPRHPQYVPVEERIFDKVDKAGPIPESRPDLGPCWIWTASRDEQGYGQIGIGRKPRRAHRVVYEVLIGPVDPRLELDHLCRNRSCVNPGHLEPVTRLENARRGISYWGSRSACANGHEYTRASSYWNGKQRRCRVCSREDGRRRRAKRRIAS